MTYPSLADPGGDLQGTDEFAKIAACRYMYFVDERRRDRLPVRPAASTPSDEVADLVREHLGVYGIL